ncbi:MAG TPA: hypothetical protein VIJ42_14185 [Stellaceae bacterium]
MPGHDVMGNMQLSFVEFLHAWRDFFIVVGTAGATLIGAMFVVISIAIGILTRERSDAAHAYLTSTVVHLGAVALASVLTMAPDLGWRGFGAVLIAGGAVGIGYVAAIGRAVRHYRVDWTDQLWYTALPLAAYIAMVGAGALSIAGDGRAMALLGAALVLLLVCGVRNAWDMILAFVTRPRATEPEK